VTLFARWGRPYAPQRRFMRPHDMSWARHSHLPLQEGSPDIPLDGVMQDAAYLLRRTHLLRPRVNKGRRIGASMLRSFSSCALCSLLGAALLYQSTYPARRAITQSSLIS